MNDVLRETAACFKDARKSVIEGAKLLYLVQKQELWKEGFGSFEEFVEEECGIGKSFAAKLTAIWRGYVIEGHATAAQLTGVDSEKLYLALKLPPEKRLASAQTLTRQDLRAERAVNPDGSEHECVPITICSKCGKRLS